MAEETKEEPATGDPTPTDEALGDNGKKALEDERKARREAAKKLADAEKRLKEYEDREKTDGEKLTERIAQAEKRANDAEARALRLEVASAKGLSAKQAGRLVGTTTEELEADADELLSSFKSEGGAPPPSKPTEQLRGGGDPTEDAPVDMRSVVESIPRGI